MTFLIFYFNNHTTRECNINNKKTFQSFQLELKFIYYKLMKYILIYKMN